jgi:hypothetical protein
MTEAQAAAFFKKEEEKISPILRSVKLDPQ